MVTNTPTRRSLRAQLAEPPTYLKAIVGAVIAFLLAFLSALLPYLQDGDTLTAEAWVTATIAGLVSLGVTGGAVYATKNTP